MRAAPDNLSNGNRSHHPAIQSSANTADSDFPNGSALEHEAPESPATFEPQHLQQQLAEPTSNGQAGHDLYEAALPRSRSPSARGANLQSNQVAVDAAAISNHALHASRGHQALPSSQQSAHVQANRVHGQGPDAAFGATLTGISSDSANSSRQDAASSQPPLTAEPTRSQRVHLNHVNSAENGAGRPVNLSQASSTSRGSEADASTQQASGNESEPSARLPAWQADFQEAAGPAAEKSSLELTSESRTAILGAIGSLLLKALRAWRLCCATHASV